MNLVTGWTEILMEEAAHIRLQQTPTTSLPAKFKNNVILLLDAIFAGLSHDYQQKRSQLNHRIRVHQANDLSEQSPKAKADQIFQRPIQSPNPLTPIKNIDEKPIVEETKHEPVNDNENEPIKHTIPKDDSIATLRSLIEQNLHEDEMITIMGDALTQDRCRQLMAQIKKEIHETKIEMIDEIKVETKYPNLFLAAQGVNQYQAGGPAACTPLACQFIASQQPASSQMLGNIITANKYTADNFLETENCIAQLHLKIAENPWESQREFSPSMQVSFDNESKMGLSAAMKSLLTSLDIGGAIFTANGVTIAMRKRGLGIEFFDSHGDATLTNQNNVNLTNKNNAAYIYTFAPGQTDLMVDYLTHRFPEIGFTPNIEIWPIR